MAENDFKCGNCRFFKNQQTIGVCKRFPTHENKHENDWCGEHSIKVVEVMALPVYDITTDQIVKPKRGRKPNAEAAA